jgi:acetyl-CoA C-acetyltransferase
VTLIAIKDLGLDEDRVNVNGGAVAIGHPIGASGARLATTLIHEMERRNERYGLATLCIGGGEAVAVVFERFGS